jgi:hypothetical protein
MKGAIMATEWFVRSGNGASGPYTSSQLKQLAQQGRISGDTELRRGSDDRWFLASKVAGLIERLPPLPLHSTSALVEPPINTPVELAALPMSLPAESFSTTQSNRNQSQIRPLLVIGGVAVFCFLVGFFVVTSRKIPVAPSPDQKILIALPKGNATNLDATCKWLFDLTTPVLNATAVDHNELKAEQAATDVGNSLSIQPTDIRWTATVSDISAKSVRLRGHWQTWTGRYGLDEYKICASIQTGIAGWSDELPIGAAISREKAITLKNGDEIIITGKLTHIESPFWDTSDESACIRIVNGGKPGDALYHDIFYNLVIDNVHVE